MRTARTTRRTFIKQAAVAGAVGPLILAGKAHAANDRKLRHASIGVGRRGAEDLAALTSHPGIEIVALCDVDQNYLEEAAKLYPKARRYRDWREMLEKERDRIDSINATVPNHMHAPISMTAMQMGKHVYCQKPLTHSIYESRRLAEEAARRPELVTQMGVQTHSSGGYRTAVAMIQFGIIGKVKEVHSWDIVRYHYTGAVTNPPMRRRPDRVDKVPDSLDWNLWLGVAPERPYVKDIYHTRFWRRWHDFGGGAHGDMGGHMMDVVFTALELTSPMWVLSHRSPPYEETFAPNNKVQYHFPRTKYTTGDIDYYWYDTGPVDAKSSWPIDQSKELPEDGSMFVGEKGYMFLPHSGSPQLLPGDELKGAAEQFNKQVGPVKGREVDHYHQFIDACLGKGKTTTPFAYSGLLTESVLMGTVVNRFPMEKLIWDAKGLQFTNKPEANKYLRRAYRDGWHVDGLG
ncbi:MAG: Gfo/Idh/MocA family oxidoreductase [Phycisphaerae bacterium]|nr:Gfo/Idh/MocA family oxidoreductase [Phycisphaerae bacterium]